MKIRYVAKFKSDLLEANELEDITPKRRRILQTLRLFCFVFSGGHGPGSAMAERHNRARVQWLCRATPEVWWWQGGKLVPPTIQTSVKFHDLVEQYIHSLWTSLL